MSDRPYRSTADGLLLEIRLTPNASRDAIEGLETLADGKTVLLARVRAVPEKGAANKALEKTLARLFSLPKSKVEVVRGATSRQKTVAIAGEPEDLAARLAAHLRKADE
ncbi:MAG: DUF167 family protein [Hyphomicrobiales bacterium]